MGRLGLSPIICSYPLIHTLFSVPAFIVQCLPFPSVYIFYLTSHHNFEIIIVIEQLGGFEICSVILFFNATKTPACEIQQQICKVYGQNDMSEDKCGNGFVSSRLAKKTSIMNHNLADHLLSQKILWLLLMQRLEDKRLTITTLAFNFD